MFRCFLARRKETCHCTFLEELCQLGVTDLSCNGVEYMTQDSWLGVVLEQRQGGLTKVSFHPCDGLLSSRAEARDDEFVAAVILLREASKAEVQCKCTEINIRDNWGLRTSRYSLQTNLRRGQCSGQ